MRDSEAVCVAAEDAPIVIGQSAPITGTNQELGTEAKRGVELAFREKNAEGGVRGRELVLEFRDDGYQPDLAEEAARDLVDARVMTSAPKCPSTSAAAPPISTTSLERGPKGVLAFIGNVGTPTMLRAAPVAIETGTIFFAALTGASTLLRDRQAESCGRFVFNVRASYAQEARATVEYFKQKGVADYQHLLSFDQNDSFGQAGYDGLVSAYESVFEPLPDRAAPEGAIRRFRYTRNDDTSVPQQVSAATARLAELLRATPGRHKVGIMMTDTYGAAATFIEQVRRWQYANDAEQTALDKAKRLDLYLSNLSFVGSNALAERLVNAGKIPTPSGEISLAEDVVVSQVVPNYQSDASEIAADYNRLIKVSGSTPSFTSFEAYVSARVFIAGLEQHEGPFTPESLVDTFEHLPSQALGLGATAGFSSKNHQYSSSVWGTALRADGSFKNLYFWSAQEPIAFFQ
jgi:branched-chain amino acid transport system substrate-binding protein